MTNAKAERLDEIIASHRESEAPLLPILHDAQAEFGCIDEASRRQIAEALNLSRAEVQGVVSFYHDFTSAPLGKPVVKLCRAEACKARGVESLVDAANAAAGDRVKIETVYCLGLCSAGPSAMVNGTVHARLDAPKLDKLIREIA
jgi:formate dehydrogenase subunit gamma